MARVVRTARTPSTSSRKSLVDRRTTTDRLLDVLLDVRGVRAAFIVDTSGDLVFARFADPRPTSETMVVALDSVARLRQAATSGVESEKSIVALRLGLLFVRRMRGAYLCALTVRGPDLDALDMTSRLVVRSLPRDPRTETGTCWTWEEDDERATLPWIPEAGTSDTDMPRSCLRAPRVPRDLAAPHDRGDEDRASGIRVAHPGIARQSRRRDR